MSGDDEDLIESDPPSATMSTLRRQMNRVVPTTVGRKVMSGVAVTALAVGLTSGYIVGHTRIGSVDSASQSGTTPGLPPGASHIPFVPDGSPLDAGVIIFTLNGTLLTADDLSALGEQPIPTGAGVNVASGLAGPCTPADPTAENGALGAVSFELTDASLRELISPDLDVLAASTLRAKVELVRNCAPSEALAVQTDGVTAGIGDEYAAFTVRRRSPTSGAVTTDYVVLVRVGGQLIEVAFSPTAGSDEPDALTRAQRIAQAAVTRMLGR